MKRKEKIAWILLIAGIAGLVICMPLWLMNLISDRAMLGITLALSWMALIYEGYNSVGIHEDDK